MNFRSPQVPDITVQELKKLMDAGERIQLLDVRQLMEREVASLGGHLVPLNELPTRVSSLPFSKDQPLIVYCRSGVRSGRAAAFLQSQGFTKVLNLKGGILAWSSEIDPSMPAY